MRRRLLRRLQDEHPLGAANGGDRLITGAVEIAAVAPGLYSANAQGTGVAAGFLRVTARGQRTEGLIFRPDTLAAVPLSLGPEGDQVYLLLYGTRIRAATAVTVTVGTVSVPVLGFAASPQFAGLDQAGSGPLPPSLTGRGVADIVVTADGKRNNTVSVTIQ